MQKIIPHLWFDKEAKEATQFYVDVLGGKINSVNVIKNTPSGDCDMVSFEVLGRDFMAISAGPYFKFNPAVSMFIVFDNESDIKNVWDKLIEGGKALMEYNTYPWAKKYGWLEDKFGLSWQLSWSENHNMKDRVTPLLMFTQDFAGKAKEAIEEYTKIFPNSNVEMMVPYEKGEGDKEGFLKHARFSLNGNNFLAMDSSGPHKFIFNEAVSFIVNCDTQEEIDHYWGKLSAHPESEQCGWLKDKFGVSWQIVPRAMDKMMTEGTPEQMSRVTQAFLKMKKFNIAELEKAYKV